MPITQITMRRGYFWRYDHPAGEPEETFDMARRVAATAVVDEARKRGKSCVVAMTVEAGAIHVLPCDDPELAALAMEVLDEMMPKGECIRRGTSARH